MAEEKVTPEIQEEAAETAPKKEKKKKVKHIILDFVKQRLLNLRF